MVIISGVPIFRIFTVMIIVPMALTPCQIGVRGSFVDKLADFNFSKKCTVGLFGLISVVSAKFHFFTSNIFILPHKQESHLIGRLRKGEGQKSIQFQ